MPEVPQEEHSAFLAWYPNLTSNSKGEVEIPIKFADNLTEWRVAVWAIDEQSRFGHTQTEITVSQDIISRPTGLGLVVLHITILTKNNQHRHPSTP